MYCADTNMRHKRTLVLLSFCLILAIAFFCYRFPQGPISSNQLFEVNPDGSLREIELKTKEALDFQISLEEALEAITWIDRAVVAGTKQDETSEYRLAIFGDNIGQNFIEDEIRSCLEQHFSSYFISDTTSYENEIIIEVVLTQGDGSSS